MENVKENEKTEAEEKAEADSVLAEMVKNLNELPDDVLDQLLENLNKIEEERKKGKK